MLGGFNSTTLICFLFEMPTGSKKYMYIKPLLPVGTSSEAPLKKVGVQLTPPILCIITIALLLVLKKVISIVLFRVQV